MRNKKLKALNKRKRNQSRRIFKDLERRKKNLRRISSKILILITQIVKMGVKMEMEISKMIKSLEM
jgi:hypothetical protein